MTTGEQKPLNLDRPLRGRIYDSIAETIGNTPLVRIPNIAAEEGITADICLKLEFFNPIASVKDRIGVNMILALEADGRLQPGGTVIEPTSGNTGIGLAFMCAARGYKLILTMPESMSIERRKMLAYLGAQLELTPREKGMNGAIARAKELQAATPGSVIPDQFGNPANPAIHVRTTAEEIWYDTDGKVDAIVSGIGTGGTLTGMRAGAEAAATRTADDRGRAGRQPGAVGRQHPGRTRSRASAPASCRRCWIRKAIDEIVQVTNEEALPMRAGWRGPRASRAAFPRAPRWPRRLKVAKRPEMAGKLIVTIIPVVRRALHHDGVVRGVVSSIQPLPRLRKPLPRDRERSRRAATRVRVTGSAQSVQVARADPITLTLVADASTSPTSWARWTVSDSHLAERLRRNTAGEVLFDRADRGPLRDRRLDLPGRAARRDRAAHASTTSRRRWRSRARRACRCCRAAAAPASAARRSTARWCIDCSKYLRRVLHVDADGAHRAGRARPRARPPQRRVASRTGCSSRSIPRRMRAARSAAWRATIPAARSRSATA